MHAHAQLVASGLAFSYGPRSILRDISLSLAPGDRVGIVGPNGTGKSTLLRLLAAELDPELGTVAANPSAATVGLMRQQLDDQPDETVGAFISRSTGVGAVLAEFEASLVDVAEGAAGSDERYDTALSRYLATDASSFDARTGQAMDEVGLQGVELTDKVAELSGGQRTKVNLAAMLLASFDVLLLDEPTNDLDQAGLDLLESMLVSQERAIAVVSHDRTFLERVITSVYELEDHAHTGKRFNGGFEAWQHARDVARQQHYDAYDEFNTKRSQLQARAQTQQQWSAAGVRKAKTDKSEPDKNIKAHRIATSEKVAGKAKQTERALERLERNERVEAPWEPWELHLDFATAERSGTDVAALHAATVRLGEFTLGPVDVAVTAGDRIMITGENGFGQDHPAPGTVRRGRTRFRLSTMLGRSAQVSTLRQQRKLFADAPSLLRGFTDAVGCDDQVARSQLAKLGLDTQRIDRPVADLSPGEQTRAALGLFAVRGSNVLVLDEPTNHLDLPAIEQLEAALQAFPHTVLLVTHDRRLLEAVTTNRHWHVEHGQLVERR